MGEKILNPPGELPINVVNDTDKWVVQLDAYFGYVDSEDEANSLLLRVFDRLLELLNLSIFLTTLFFIT